MQTHLPAYMVSHVRWQ